MKIIFLDIDGVVNCATTTQRHRGFIGIDPFLALLVNRIIEATGAKVVLSSSWRLTPDGCEEVRKQVCDFIDVTPTSRGMESRGSEIKRWLDAHPEVKKFAILDDNSDMHDYQMPSFFKTSWDTGITQEVVERVIKHLGRDPKAPVTMKDGKEAWITASGRYYARRNPHYEKWDSIGYYTLEGEPISLAKATCPECKETIESKMCGDFVACKCKKSFVDTDRWMPERHRYGGLIVKLNEEL